MKVCVAAPHCEIAPRVVVCVVSLVLINVTATGLLHVKLATFTTIEPPGETRVGVLGLFRPHQFALSPLANSALVVHVGAESVVLEASSGVNIAHICVRGDNVVLAVGTRVLRAPKVTVTSRENGLVDFNLAVPGKITRHYRGALELKPASRVLTAVVTMDIETAVASVVAAEGTVYVESVAPTIALKVEVPGAASYH